MIDSHCHLDGEKFANDLDAVLARAAEAGVRQMLTIGTGEPACAIAVAERYPQVFASVGVHPHDAAQIEVARIRPLVTHPKVVALGEIGLDYHYDFSPRGAQRAAFIEQLQIAREAKLPIVIHTREAWDDTIRILRDEWRGQGIMHCFTGTPAQAAEALELGFHLAFGGVLTFRTAEEVREAAKLVPDDRLLIETDAPYLAPIPYRGKRNEPAFIAHTAQKLAEVRGAGVEHIDAVTTANFHNLCLAARYTNVSDGN